jgi:hypothetical protein
VRRNNQPTIEQGMAKVARGRQAAGEAKRKSSSAQCNNQPTMEGGSAKVARGRSADAKRRRSRCNITTSQLHQSKERQGGKGEASGSRSKVEEQRHRRQQSASNRAGISKGSNGKASSGGSKEEEQCCICNSQPMMEWGREKVARG